MATNRNREGRSLRRRPVGRRFFVPCQPGSGEGCALPSGGRREKETGKGKGAGQSRFAPSYRFWRAAFSTGKQGCPGDGEKREGPHFVNGAKRAGIEGCQKVALVRLKTPSFSVGRRGKRKREKNERDKGPCYSIKNRGKQIRNVTES
ncbi:hypothetical protein HMPREF0262_01834 [Clostridium sp. ATCC 29733]|nr:hypothetical protein HMPREF0262_01834 [Clostridium sp. ATCC 29733]